MSAAFLRTDAHALRDLDELDLVAREHAPVLVEARPVGVGAPHDDPSPLGERVGDRPEVEDRQMQLLPRADREVLVVEEECDAFFVRAVPSGPTLRGCAVVLGNRLPAEIARLERPTVPRRYAASFCSTRSPWEST